MAKDRSQRRQKGYKSDGRPNYEWSDPQGRFPGEPGYGTGESRGERRKPKDGGQTPFDDLPRPPAGNAFQQAIDAVVSSSAVKSAERSDVLDVVTYHDGSILHIAKKENDPDDPDDDTVVITLYQVGEEEMEWEDTPENVAEFVQEYTALKEEKKRQEFNAAAIMVADKGYRWYRKRRRRRKAKRKRNNSSRSSNIPGGRSFRKFINMALHPFGG